MICVRHLHHVAFVALSKVRRVEVAKRGLVVSAEPAISVPIGDGQITGYSCTNKAAYRSVCAFASLLFIANVAFTAVLVRRKDEVIEGGGKATPASSAYTNVGAPAGGASPGFAQQGAAYNPGGYGGQGKSVADL